MANSLLGMLHQRLSGRWAERERETGRPMGVQNVAALAALEFLKPPDPLMPTQNPQLQEMGITHEISPQALEGFAFGGMAGKPKKIKKILKQQEEMYTGAQKVAGAYGKKDPESVSMVMDELVLAADDMVTSSRYHDELMKLGYSFDDALAMENYRWHKNPRPDLKKSMDEMRKAGHSELEVEGFITQEQYDELTRLRTRGQELVEKLPMLKQYMDDPDKFFSFIKEFMKAIKE
jgi:hypothetical protein|tara:strand:- start:52 stop:753 length:702 start_codon:yes stop_codon:yes gene_type:complete